MHEEMINSDVASLLGLPWKENGFDINGSGLNCWGLVRAVFKINGHDLPDYESIVGRTIDGITKAYHIQIKDFIEVRWPRRLDLVAMSSIMSDLYIDHVGVVLNDECFIHSRQHVGVAISKLSNRMYKKMIRGFYRWHKLITS